MDKKLDAFLERALKKWLSQQPPPTDGRERLMRQAERVHFRRLARAILPDELAILRPSTSPISAQWPQRDFNWTMALWVGNETVDPGKFWSESLQLRAS